MSFTTDSRLARQRQITTLKVYNASVEEIVDGSEFKIKFAAAGLELDLVVVLPPSFPTGSPPVVLVRPCVQHPWVHQGSGQVTGAPGLNSFNHHSDLGMVVNAIKRELEKSEGLTISHQHQQEPPIDTGAGDPVRSRLGAMEREELLEILDSEEAMLKFVDSLQYPPLQSMEDNIKSMEEHLVLTAESNMEMQAEIEAGRDSLLQKVETFHSEKGLLSSAYSRSRELAARVEGATLADKLLRLSVENEEVSDNIAERFLTKQMDVDTFVKEYIASRQLCHLQKLKADKVKHV